MLEKYFQEGVRLKWTFPGDYASGAHDGSIIDNPGLPKQQMTYQGMDTALFDFTKPRVSTLRVTNNTPITHDWLVYAVGRTTKIPIGTSDILTGRMSGCPIPVWTEGETTYVGHIGTGENKDTNDLVKSTFAYALPLGVVGYEPYDCWTTAEMMTLQKKFGKKMPTPHVMALITTSKVCHSLLFFQLAPNEWCVGGVKLVPLMTRTELHTFLTKAKTV